MEKFLQGVCWCTLLLLPCLLSLPYDGDKDVNIDPDMLNSIFGDSLDSARYGAVEEEWEEIPITLIPGEDSCQPLQQPRPEPGLISLHEELKQVVVLKAAAGKKCDHYQATQGFECVPYYQCGEDGEIITDGYGLIDIRFGGEGEGNPELAVLDSSDLMCPGSMDVCCKNPDFVAPTRSPLVTENPGYGGETESSEEEIDGNGGNGKGYGGGGEGEGGEEEEGYGGGTGGEDGNSSEEEEGRNQDGDGDGGSEDFGYGGEVCVGDCTKTSEKLTFQPQCGRRNQYGLGVRIQNYQDGESQFGEFPHICAILKKDIVTGGYGEVEEVKVFKGGASLIAPGILLTAAHKIFDFASDPASLVVRCGEWDTQTEGEPLQHQDRQVKEIILHPDFHPKTLANTAALIIVESDFVLAEHIDTICLPEYQENFQEETECFVKGWGKDKWEQGEYQVVMKKVSVPMVPSQQCLDMLRATRLGRRFKLDPSFVCAGGEAGRDACRGDGGGPLVCPLKSNRDHYVQVGIIAWGIGCGEENVPGVYSSVSQHVCWIDWALRCSLGNNYTLRYGSECQEWLRAKQARDRRGAYSCQVTWPQPRTNPTPGYGGAELPTKVPVQTLPGKIKSKNIGGY